PLPHATAAALAERIEPTGAASGDFAELLARSADALTWLRARQAAGDLPLLAYPRKHDDLTELRDTAARLSADATDIVILGTGGSRPPGHNPIPPPPHPA